MGTMAAFTGTVMLKFLENRPPLLTSQGNTWGLPWPAGSAIDDTTSPPDGTTT